MNRVITLESMSSVMYYKSHVLQQPGNATTGNEPIVLADGMEIKYLRFSFSLGMMTI